MKKQNDSPVHPKSDIQELPLYVKRTRDLVEAEMVYLEARRENNQLTRIKQLPKEDENKKGKSPNDVVGLCISGGGVRSATLGLGMMQAFIKKDLLKHVDYLSTVSGGGYIGSCLTSLLSAEPDWRERKKPKPNHRFDAAWFGTQKDNAPFFTEKDDSEYKPLDEAELSVKQQLRHIRRHGEYLTPRKNFFGWDVNRLVGGLTGGMLSNMFTFLLILCVIVSGHHLLFHWSSDGRFFEHLFKPLDYLGAQTAYQRLDEGAWATMSTLKQLSFWFSNMLIPQFHLVWNGIAEHLGLAGWFAAAGGLCAVGLYIWLIFLPTRIVREEEQEQSFAAGDKPETVLQRPGETSVQEYRSRWFIRVFNLLNYAAGPIAAYALALSGYFRGKMDDETSYLGALALPFCFSAGLFLVTQSALVLFSFSVTKWRPQISDRLYRSFYLAMQGGVLLGLFISVLIPAGIIFLFGGHSVAYWLALTLVPVGISYYFTLQALSSRAGGDGGFLPSVVNAVRMPMLNLSILLVTGMAIAKVSDVLHGLAEDKICTPEALFIGSSVLLVLMGILVDSNLLSLHYFYRDRLAEAYLRTIGRTANFETRTDAPANPFDPQGLPDVCLRDHEELLLSDLGKGNFRGPYHLVVAAINLQGSNDLAKKTQRSDHFIFSKYYVGSPPTGYCRTDKYRGGRTKLGTAMAISAAAMASGMGALSFPASNFYMTLFNLRTGYWIENPMVQAQKHWPRDKRPTSKRLFFRKVAQTVNGAAKWVAAKALKMWDKAPFWLLYLGREFTGQMNASTRRVYVSDGGHSGDNLGIIPLIQRKCGLIVACDFEQDAGFQFESFYHAVRLAKSVHSADIHIDLSQLIPRKDDNGDMYSPACVAEGTVTYRDQTVGKIIYLKSSVNLLPESDEEGNRHPERAPAYALGYLKAHSSFPHESTADQYFDDVQFEAYQALGEHLGHQGAEILKRRLKELCR